MTDAPAPILTILRGLPGSGKTTLARTVSGVYVSPDSFRYVGGIYMFKPGDNTPFELTQQVVALAMERAVDVVIDATHVRLGQYNTYVEMGIEYGYAMRVRYPETAWAWDPRECAKRNTHNVPFDVISKMFGDFEALPTNLEEKRRVWIDSAPHES